MTSKWSNEILTMEEERDEKVDANKLVSFERKDINPPELNIQSDVSINHDWEYNFMSLRDSFVSNEFPNQI